MNYNNYTNHIELKKKNKQIILNVALSLNKELFDENKISYKMYKYTEENIIKELQNFNLNCTNANILE